jgi:hypothetical protein
MSYNKILNFKYFILRESDEFLKEKIGKIYGDLQQVQQTMKQVGTDTLLNDVKVVISQIRAIIQGHWLKQQFKYLEVLQKAGVALANAVEENDNLENIVNASVDIIKSEIMDKLSGPINDLGVEPEDQPVEEPTSDMAPPTEPSIAGTGTVQATQGMATPPLGQPPEGALRI